MMIHTLFCMMPALPTATHTNRCLNHHCLPHWSRCRAGQRNWSICGSCSAERTRGMTNSCLRNLHASRFPSPAMLKLVAIIFFVEVAAERPRISQRVLELDQDISGNTQANPMDDYLTSLRTRDLDGCVKVLLWAPLRLVGFRGRRWVAPTH